MDVHREETFNRKMNPKNRKETLSKSTKKNQQSLSKHTIIIIDLNISAGQVLLVKREMKMVWINSNMLQTQGSLISQSQVMRLRSTILEVTLLMFIL